MAGDQLVATGMNLTDSGLVRVQAFFPGVFDFSTQIVGLRVVRFQRLDVQLWYYGGGAGDGQTLRQLHCSGVFEGVDVRASGTLSDGSVYDVTRFTGVGSTDSSVAKARGSQVYGTGVGWATLEFTFASVALLRGIAVVNASVHLASVSIVGFPLNLTGSVNTSVTARLSARFENGAVLTMDQTEAGVPWTEPGRLRGQLFTFTSDEAGSLSVGKSDGRVTLQGNSYRPVSISASAVVCDGFTTGTEVSVSPNLAANGDGDVDVGEATGVALKPVTSGSSVQIPVFLRSDGLLKSFEILLSVDKTFLSVDGCTGAAGWSGAFSCTINDPVGSVFIVGADVTSSRTGARIHVANVVVQGAGGGITEVAGVRVKVSSSLSDNLCSGCAIVAGRAPMRIVGPTGNPRRRLIATAPEPQTSSDRVRGDVNGDGVFDTSDYLLAQEYSLAPDGLLGCPSFGGIGCTDGGALTPWQLKQMDPVSDPLLPATAPGGNDLGFLLSVYGGKQRFLDGWAAESDSASGLSMRVRLLDKSGRAASQRCSVKFMLATARNKGAVFRTQSKTTTEGELVLAEYLGDGWYGISSAGALRAEERVSFMFMVETQDGTGEGDDAMRRFPFYGTHIPPYSLYYPAFREFSTVSIHEYTPQSSDTPVGSETPRSELTELTTPTPSEAPQTAATTAVGVAAGTSLLFLVGLVEVGRRYWYTAAPATIAARSQPPTAPVLRIRLGYPRK